jgi:hypothetical protein
VGKQARLTRAGAVIFDDYARHRGCGRMLEQSHELGAPYALGQPSSQGKQPHKGEAPPGGAPLSPLASAFPSELAGLGLGG